MNEREIDGNQFLSMLAGGLNGRAVASQRVDDQVNGAARRAYRGKHPEQRVLKGSAPEVGDYQSADVEYEVQRHCPPYIARFKRHCGKHHSRQEGIAHLQQRCGQRGALCKVEQVEKPERRRRRCHGQYETVRLIPEHVAEQLQCYPAEQQLLARGYGEAFYKEQPDQLGAVDARAARYQRRVRKVCQRHGKAGQAPRDIRAYVPPPHCKQLFSAAQRGERDHGNGKRAAHGAVSRKRVRRFVGAERHRQRVYYNERRGAQRYRPRGGYRVFFHTQIVQQTRLSVNTCGANGIKCGPMRIHACKKGSRFASSCRILQKYCGFCGISCRILKISRFRRLCAYPF